MSDSFPFSPCDPLAQCPENGNVLGWTGPDFPQASLPLRGLTMVTAGQPETSIYTAAVSLPEYSLNSKVPIPRSVTSNAAPNRAGNAQHVVDVRNPGLTAHTVIENEINWLARVGSVGTLLQNIYPNLDSLSTQYVEQILSDQYDNNRPLSPFPSETPSLFTTDTGSPIDAIDFTNEDFNSDEEIQAMEFVGEHSEIAWMYRLKKFLCRFHQGPLGKSLDRKNITTAKSNDGEEPQDDLFLASTTLLSHSQETSRRRSMSLEWPHWVGRFPMETAGESVGEKSGVLLYRGLFCLLHCFH
ncbi:uncharacterized protein BDV17DRAFT_31295 [Aspergillus undulatus]|uniref:uncharacterized protein n=1 Tax=Aspergillus undulatus TaxID=1810928 RepID=UPI003CCD7FE3